MGWAALLSFVHSYYLPRLYCPSPLFSIFGESLLPAKTVLLASCFFTFAFSDCKKIIPFECS